MTKEMTKEMKFMLESNRIEGEDRINPGDFEAVGYTLNEFKKSQNIIAIHRILGDYLKKPWVGVYRSCNVYIGNYTPLDFRRVPELMTSYMDKFNNLNAWEAHNEFERIHPFQDLNGRVGRLIWLYKALKEGYDFTIPFLQMYYYQTLREYER